MIYYNSNIINDWNFGDDNIIKVYKHGAVVFYKFDNEQGGYKVCYAVVDDITQYSETEFEDVYDKATEKWYKLNNLNQYEEYGVYGSGRTSCEGSTSRLPQGYTEVEYIENTSTAYINTDLQIYSSATNSFEVESKLIAAKHDSQSYQNVFSCMSEDGEPYQGFTYRYQSSSLVGTSIPNGQNTFTIVNNEDSTQTVTVTSSSSQRTYTHTYPLTLFCGLNSSRSPFRWTNSKFYYCKIKMNNELVRDLVPCKRDSDDKYGMYDLITDTFYVSPNNVDFSGGEPITPTDCVTTYNGKLTIDDGYEYEWNGSSWVNLGEVSGSSRVPIGYTEVEYIQNTGTSYINTNFKPNQDTRIVCTMQCVTSSQYGRYIGAGDYNAVNGIQFDYESGAQGTLHISWGHLNSWTVYSNCVGDYNVHTYDWNKNYFYRDKGETNQFSASTTYTAFQCVANLGIFCHIYNNGGVPTSQNEYMVGKMYSFQIYDNGTLVRDFVPCKRDSDSKYGVYDVVNNTFYSSANSTALSGGSETGTTEYPKYYSEKSEPLYNLTFNTMEEADDYAYNNCVYVGFKATINGDKYVFSGDSQSGYEWVYNPSRLPVGYTEVEYIQNTGTSYLDIDFKPNSDTRILTEMQAVSSASYPRLFGAGMWNASLGINLAYQQDGGSTCLHINWYGRTSWSYYTSFTYDYDKHTYDLNKNYLYRDETLVGSTSYTSSYQSTDNLGVFTYMANGRPSSSSYWGNEHFKGKMYSFQVYDNGTLVRDLVPCIRDNDNTVGAYDIVNDVFYTVPTGYTTDKLIAGDPV